MFKFRSSLMAVAVLGAAALSALAQPDIEPGPRPLRPVVPASDANPVLDLDFKGGSVTEYLEAVQAASGQYRVVAMPGLEAFTMPAVKLTNVTLGAAVSAVTQARVPDSSVKSFVGLNYQDGVYTVYGQIERNSREAQSSHVWQLGSLIESGLKAEDILSAVEASVSLLDSPCVVKYHEGTRLLLANCTSEQGNAVNNVLARLEETVQRRGLGASGPQQAELEALEQSRDSLASRVRELEDHVARLVGERDSVAAQLAQMREELAQREQHFTVQLTELQVRLQDAENRANRYENAWLELERMRLRREIEQEKMGLDPAEPAPSGAGKQR